MNFQVERMRRLARNARETWQGGVFKMGTWVKDEEGNLVRPWIAAWISLKTRFLHLSELRTEKVEGFDIALQALADFASQQLAGYRPGKVQVKDPALADYLREMLAELEIEVELRERLMIIEEVLGEMAQKVFERPPVPDALEVKGVTADAMRAFAEAAAEFYRAGPWEHLSSNDLIEIESPPAEAGLRCTTVLGAGGDAFGLGFYGSRKEFQSLLANPDPKFLESQERWSVLFGPIQDLPFGDVDLWEDQDLPVAGEEAYPLAICFHPRGKHRRPGPDLLAFFEGLLRALARTSEEEFDTGRWTKQVDTFKGPREFTLALPDLLKTGKEKRGKPGTRLFNPLAMERVMADIETALESREFESEEEVEDFLQKNLSGPQPQEREPTTPLERAQDLVYRAYDTEGRRQIQMARQALEISPDCVDAYILLAERSSDPDKQLAYYTQALQAAERPLEADIFENEAGRFWGIVKTRPYMRARFGLATSLENLGRLEEAAEHYRELLRLNPDDNQGVRSSLWSCLLRLGQDEEADALLKQYKGDKGRCAWNYTRALLTFRQKGDTQTARKHLRQAIDDNPFVADYLLGEEPPPGPPVPYELGSEEEAIACVDSLIDAWEETPGALDWLEEVVQRSR